MLIDPASRLRRLPGSARISTSTANPRRRHGYRETCETAEDPSSQSPSRSGRAGVRTPCGHEHAVRLVTAAPLVAKGRDDCHEDRQYRTSSPTPTEESPAADATAATRKARGKRRAGKVSVPRSRLEPFWLNTQLHCFAAARRHFVGFPTVVGLGKQLLARPSALFTHKPGGRADGALLTSHQQGGAAAWPVAANRPWACRRNAGGLPAAALGNKRIQLVRLNNPPTQRTMFFLGKSDDQRMCSSSPCSASSLR
jgi:hypothetical protein